MMLLFQTRAANKTRAGNTSRAKLSAALVLCKSPWFNMIKRLCKLNDWLPLVKDLVAHRAPYHRRKHLFYTLQLAKCLATTRISHIKLTVIRMGVLVLFSDFFFSKWQAN